MKNIIIFLSLVCGMAFDFCIKYKFDISVDDAFMLVASSESEEQERARADNWDSIMRMCGYSQRFDYQPDTSTTDDPSKRNEENQNIGIRNPRNGMRIQFKFIKKTDFRHDYTYRSKIVWAMYSIGIPTLCRIGSGVLVLLFIFIFAKTYCYPSKDRQ